MPIRIDLFPADFGLYESIFNLSNDEFFEHIAAPLIEIKELAHPVDEQIVSIRSFNFQRQPFLDLYLFHVRHDVEKRQRRVGKQIGLGVTDNPHGQFRLSRCYTVIFRVVHEIRP